MDYWLLTMPHMHSVIVDKLVNLGYNFDIRLLGVDLEFVCKLTKDFYHTCIETPTHN